MTARSLPLRTLLLGATALALAGATAFAGQQLLAAQDAAAPVTPAAEPVAATRVLVAARALETGAAVAAGDLEWRAWPAAGRNPAHIVEGSQPLAGFTGQVMRADLLAGEPVTAGRLAAPGARGALALVTGTGRRAVSVAVTPTSGVSGLIVPGDRVDVVLTYALPQPADTATAGFERRAATTILSDLRVLAIDQRLAASGAVATGDVRNASLEVTAQQAEALALAADLGKLTLSLRSLDRSFERRGGATSGGGGSTLDYQVGRLLPGLGGRVRAGVAAVTAAAPSRPAGPQFAQFHGSKADGAGTTP